MCRFLTGILFVVLATGCGRIGYDPLQSIDGGSDIDASISASFELGTELILPLGSGSKDNPSAIWVVDRLVLGWKASVDNTAKVATLDAEGGLLNGPFSISGGLPADDVALASSGTHIGTVWLEGADDIVARAYFRLLLPTGEPATAPIVLSPAGPDIRDPQIAWTGSRFFVTWTDLTGTATIHQVILDEAGNIESPDSIFQPTGNSQDEAALANVAGTLYAAWRDDKQIHATVISSSGVVATSRAVTTGPDSSNFPSVAGNASEFAIAYHSDRSGFQGVYVAFDGLESSELTIEGAPLQSSEDVVIEFGSTSYALVWDGSGVSGAEGFTEYALMSRADGILARGTLSEESHTASAHPALVWTGDTFLAIWEYRYQGQDELGFRSISP